MDKTSFKQKLLLVIFGVFFALVLLEMGLRMAGAVVLYLQERHNHVSFNPNEYRILCLGESTTALGGEDSYPSQLERMLNAQAGAKRFTVINKGIISTTTEYILAHAGQNLDMYRPQMVVVMMGINDRVYLHDLNKSLWWENVKSFLEGLRVYKLGSLLYERIVHRPKQADAAAQAADLSADDGGNYQQVEDFLKVVIAQCLERFHGHLSAAAQYQRAGQLGQANMEEQFARESLFEAGTVCAQLAERYRIQGLFREAQGMLEEASNFNPDSPAVDREWGDFYLAQGQSGQAVKAYEAALALDPKNSDDLLGLAHAYYQEHSDNAYLIYAGYLQVKPDDYWGYLELARWLKENNHNDLAQVYLDRAEKISPDFDHAQKAAASQMVEYCPATLVNYNLLLDKILSRHIKVVVMQYPLRDIGILKDYLGQRKGVAFVENKQNFRQALLTQGYWYYFKDNFAHNFGHCTRSGNELIARNLAEAVLKNE